MVDTSMITDVVVAVSILAGTLFAMVQIREMAKDRRIELMLRFSDTWLTPEFEDPLSKLIRGKFSDGEEAERICSAAGLQLIADYFEIMGSYVKSGLLDRDEVLALYPVEWSWEKLKPWIIYERSTTGIDGLHDTFEWLAGEERKMRPASGQK